VTVRAVVDTNVIVSGLLSPRGPPGDLLLGAGSLYELIWTAALIVECRQVLGRPRIARRLGRQASVAEAALSRLVKLASVVESDRLPTGRIVPEDPDDDVLFGTALAGGARFIVTGDAAVLRVGQFAGIQVVTMAEFLALLGSGPGG